MIETHRASGVSLDGGNLVVNLVGRHLYAIKGAKFAATDEFGCGMRKCRGRASWRFFRTCWRAGRSAGSS